MVHKGISKESAESFVQSFFSVIENGLTTEKFVKVKGFGTFKLVSVGDRESINISTGERFQINGHLKVSFTPDATLKEIINRPFAHFEAINLEEDTTLEELETVDRQMDELYPQAKEEIPADETEEILTEETEETDEAVDETDETIEQPDAANESVTDESEEPAPTAEIAESIVTPTIIPISEAAEDAEDAENAAEESETTENGTLALSEKAIAIVEGQVSLEPEQPAEEKEPTVLPSTEGPQEPEIVATEEPTVEETGHPVNEEENDVRVSEPQPITPTENSNGNIPSNMEYTYTEIPPRKHCNWWKAIAIALLAIILMAASYFAGYYRLLCPSCHTIDNAEAERELVETPPAPSTEARPEVSAEPKPGADAKPSPSPKAAESPAPADQKSQPAAQPQAKPAEKAQAAAPAKEQTKSAETEKPSIVRHTVKPGENLTRIVRKYYGSDTYVGKVIRHNHLRDADNVTVGTVLELPMN